MDPITSLSVACNVIQLVEVSSKAAYTCWQIYNDGQDIANAALNENIGHLDQALSEIQSNTAQGLSGPLRDVSTSCQKTARLLKQNLDELRLIPKSSLRKAVGKTIKSTVKAHEIRRIKDQLDNDTRVLNTTILVDLRNKLALSDQNQLQAILSLDQEVQKLGDRLKDENVKIESMIDSDTKILLAKIDDESQITRDYISTSLTAAIETFELSQLRTEAYEQTMRHLSFPEMHKRQEEIKDAHRQTFEWIFDTNSNQDCKWDSFISWLECEGELYWIKGKPGAGKSTLMNFLVSDHRTQAALERWSSPKPCLILSYFIVDAGTKLQKSEVGLLRTLLWRLLDADRQLNFHVWRNLSTVFRDLAFNAWTRKRLLNVFKTAVSLSNLSICFFLDGLDEFEDEDTLLEIVEELQALPGVKLCVASRPSVAYQEAFQPYPSLRLQDLTRPDIEKYVTEKLSDSRGVQSLLERDPEFISRSLDIILEGAEGIFLWVYLVVKSLLTGIRNGDEPELLTFRLQNLPKGIFELYEDMWNRLSLTNHVYKEEAANYFQIATEFPYLPLILFGIAINKQMQERILDFSTTEDVLNAFSDFDCAKVEKQIMARCGDFLEVSIERSTTHSPVNVWTTYLIDEHRFWTLSNKSNNQNSLEKLRQSLRKVFKAYEQHQITFVHRTATEFLTETSVGAKILSAEKQISPQDFDVYSRIVKPLVFRSYLTLRVLLAFARGFCHWAAEVTRTILHFELHNWDEKTREEILQKEYNIVRELGHHGFIQLGKGINLGPFATKFPQLNEGGIDNHLFHIFRMPCSFLRSMPANELKKFSVRPKADISAALCAWARTFSSRMFIFEWVRCDDIEDHQILSDLRWFLDNGANPNERIRDRGFGSDSAMNYTLCQLLRMTQQEKYRHGDSLALPMLRLDRLVEVFLQYGANPNAISTPSIDDWTLASVGIGQGRILCETNALALIQASTWIDPEEKTRAQTLLIEAGATLHFKLRLIYDGQRSVWVKPADEIAEIFETRFCNGQAGVRYRWTDISSTLLQVIGFEDTLRDSFVSGTEILTISDVANALEWSERRLDKLQQMAVIVEEECTVRVSSMFEAAHFQSSLIMALDFSEIMSPPVKFKDIQWTGFDFIYDPRDRLIFTDLSFGMGTNDWAEKREGASKEADSEVMNQDFTPQ